MSNALDRQLPHRKEALTSSNTVDYNDTQIDLLQYQSILSVKALSQWKNMDTSIRKDDLRLSKKTLYHLLFDIFPLSFSQFIRIQPLNKQLKFYYLELQTLQKLLAQRCNEVLPQLNTLDDPQQNSLKKYKISNSDMNLSLHNFQYTSQLPSLSLLYSAYIKYRKLHQNIYKSIVFQQYRSFDTFKLLYTPSAPQHQQANNEFNISFERKKDLYLRNNGPLTSSPTWLLITHLPLHLPVRDIRAVLLNYSVGYSRMITLPLEPTSHTRSIFVEYTSQSARDDAIITLNNGTIPWATHEDTAKPVKNNPQKQKDQKKKNNNNNSTTNNTNSSDKNNQENTKQTNNAKYRIRVTPWYNTKQFLLDKEELNKNGTPLRHPLFPIGPKQWLTGPIPKSKLLPRLGKDIQQLRLLALFFDTLHIIHPNTNCEQLLSKIAVEVPNMYSIIHLPLTEPGVATTNENSEFLFILVRFLTKYLRDVHFFDYWTGSLYPTLSALQTDIGVDWEISDLPTESSEHRKACLYAMINDAVVTTENDMSEGQTIPDVVLPSLETFPLDSVLPPEQLSITAFYNALFAVSPHVQWHPVGISTNIGQLTSFASLNEINNKSSASSVTTTAATKASLQPLIPYNIWHLTTLYDQQYISQSNVNPMVAAHRHMIYLLSPSFVPDNQSTGESNNTTVKDKTNTFFGHDFLSTVTRSEHERFWDHVDKVYQLVNKIFDISTINPHAVASLDTLNPEYFAICKSLEASSYYRYNNFVWNSNFEKLLQDVVYIGKYVQPRAASRFSCRECNKMFVSVQSITQHVKNFHNISTLQKDCKDAQLYQSFQSDPIALCMQPFHITSSLQRAFHTHNKNNNNNNTQKIHNKNTKLLVFENSFWKNTHKINQNIDHFWEKALKQFQHIVNYQTQAKTNDLINLQTRLNSSNIPKWKLAADQISKETSSIVTRPHFSDNDQFGTCFVPPTLCWDSLADYVNINNTYFTAPLSEQVNTKYDKKLSDLQFTETNVISSEFYHDNDMHNDDVSENNNDDYDDKKKEFIKSLLKIDYTKLSLDSFASYISQLNTIESCFTGIATPDEILSSVQQQHRGICKYLLLTYGSPTIDTDNNTSDQATVDNVIPSTASQREQELFAGREIPSFFVAPNVRLEIQKTVPQFDPFINL